MLLIRKYVGVVSHCVMLGRILQQLNASGSESSRTRRWCSWNLVSHLATELRISQYFWWTDNSWTINSSYSIEFYARSRVICSLRTPHHCDYLHLLSWKFVPSALECRTTSLHHVTYRSNVTWCYKKCSVSFFFFGLECNWTWNIHCKEWK